MESEEIQKQADIIKCPNCGANMSFDPDKQKLHCEHCDSLIDFTKDQSITERDFRLRESDMESWQDETVVIRCTNCGNKEVVSKTDISKTCPFCGTSNIIEIDELPGIKPGVVFPFTISKEKCLGIVKNWAKHKWFVPTDFKKKTDLNNISGLYHPAWTFDSYTVSNYNGVLGKNVVKTVGSGKDRRTVVEVKYFNVSGVYNKFFDDIIIEAGPALDEKTFEKIRPFNKDVAVVYDKKYLAGFSANHYDKSIDNAFIDAKNKMEGQIRQLIIQQYNADVVQSLNINTYHNDVSFKYVLLPVWIGHFNYKDKIYHYYVNGNSGRVIGKVPRSLAKIAIFAGWVFVALAAASGIYYVINGFSFEDDNKDAKSEYRIETKEANVYELPGYRFKY